MQPGEGSKTGWQRWCITFKRLTGGAHSCPKTDREQGPLEFKWSPHLLEARDSSVNRLHVERGLHLRLLGLSAQGLRSMHPCEVAIAYSLVEQPGIQVFLESLTTQVAFERDIK